MHAVTWTADQSPNYNTWPLWQERVKKNKTVLDRCQVTPDPWEKNALNRKSSAHNTALLSDPLWTLSGLLHKIKSLLRTGYNEVSSTRCLPSPSLLLPPGTCRGWAFMLAFLPGNTLTISLEPYKATLGKVGNVISISYLDRYLKKKHSAFCLLCLNYSIQGFFSLSKSGSFPV